MSYTPAQMRKAARAVYVAVDESVARELAAMLRQGADAVEALAEARQAVGLATTLHGQLEIDVNDPVGMMQKIVAHVTEALAEYEAAAQFPGDDQRHRGTSTAMQLVHCQHKREQAEAALAAERVKVRKLREWLVAHRTDLSSIDLMRMAYGRIIEKMDELSLTGQEPR